MVDDASGLVVLSGESTVRDSLRILYRTAFKVAKLVIDEEARLISKDELVAALEKGFGDMPLREVLWPKGSQSIGTMGEVTPPFPLLRIEDCFIFANEAARELIGQSSIEKLGLKEDTSECAMLNLESGEFALVEPLGYGFFIVKKLDKKEVEEILETARWAAIGKTLWRYLEDRGLTIKVEEQSKKGNIPLSWKGLEFGFLMCRKTRKNKGRTKKKNGNSSVS